MPLNHSRHLRFGNGMEGQNARATSLSGLKFNWPVPMAKWLGIACAVLATGLHSPVPAFAQFADGVGPAVAGQIYAIALQGDGKILVGGRFSALGGKARNNIGRFTASGTVDEAFDPGANGPVNCLAVQPDGKIVVGGNFTVLGGEGRDHLGRLNVDGSLDTYVSGPNAEVNALAVQSDGKILVGGRFTFVSGQPRDSLARFNANLSLDSSFIPRLQVGFPYPYPVVWSVAVQTNGQILVGGIFTNLAGQARANIGRLNANGSLDSGFNPGANSWVQCLTLQSDGRILVGGNFSLLGGEAHGLVGRLNVDGSLDRSFNPVIAGDSFTNPWILSVSVQADGRIWLGGIFLSVGGQRRNGIARVNADGTVDAAFNPDNGIAALSVNAIVIQVDGKVLVNAGNASDLFNKSLRRIDPTEPATRSLSYVDSRVRWRRGGTGPEFWRTIYEVTTNGQRWVNLGAGTRVDGGWDSVVVALPMNSIVRARGFVTGGQNNGSTWLIEEQLPWPQPSVARLGIAYATNGVFDLSLFGRSGETLDLRTATNLAEPWSFVQTITLTNSLQTLRWTNHSEAERYFQVQPR